MRPGFYMMLILSLVITILSFKANKKDRCDKSFIMYINTIFILLIAMVFINIYVYWF